MKNRKLMRLFLDNPIKIRNIVLTDNQIGIIRIIQKDYKQGISARELCTIKDISIQNASAMLIKLYRIGYLTRAEKVADSGGIEFSYESAL